MLPKLEDPAVVKPQTLPNGVSSLHRRVEWTHGSLIAVDKVSVDVYDQVLVSFIKSLKHEPSPQTALVKLIVDCLSFPKEACQVLRHGLVLRFIRLECGRLQQGVVPVFGPNSVRIAGAGWPGKHSVGEVHTERLAKELQQPFGIFEDITRVDDGRHLALARSHPVKDLELLRQS